MTSMPSGTVQLTIADGVATVTLDRPESLNSMTDGLMDDVRAALTLAEDSRDARVVVLTGNGRGFCSGADLNEVEQPSADNPNGGAPPPGESMDDHFHPTIRALNECGLPTVARVNGVAAGGGLGLALGCDIAIAARSAFFVATFAPKLGIVPDLGSTWHLPARLGRARALGLAMLGDRLSAEDAEQWGLIYKAVEDASLDDEVARVVGILRRSSPEAIVRTRSAIDSASQRTLSDQLEVEGDHQRVLIPMNMSEGAAAFLAKREPDFGR